MLAKRGIEIDFFECKMAQLSSILAELGQWELCWVMPNVASYCPKPECTLKQVFNKYVPEQKHILVWKPNCWGVGTLFCSTRVFGIFWRGPLERRTCPKPRILDKKNVSPAKAKPCLDNALRNYHALPQHLPVRADFLNQLVQDFFYPRMMLSFFFCFLHTSFDFGNFSRELQKKQCV